jgi:hypothetical protein
VKTLRGALLELHRAIVAIEREDHERRTGVASAGEFLRLLVEDDSWAWLRPLSALIVQIDEGAGDVTVIAAETRKLLMPDSAGTPFQQRYAWLMDRSPEVTYAHGAVMKALKNA